MKRQKELKSRQDFVDFIELKGFEPSDIEIASRIDHEPMRHEWRRDLKLSSDIQRINELKSIYFWTTTFQNFQSSFSIDFYSDSLVDIEYKTQGMLEELQHYLLLEDNWKFIKDRLSELKQTTVLEIERKMKTVSKLTPKLLEKEKYSGPAEVLFSNGLIKAQGTYIDSLLNGPVVSFYFNGKVSSFETYSRGRLISFVLYDNKGNVDERNKEKSEIWQRSLESRLLGV